MKLSVVFLLVFSMMALTSGQILILCYLNILNFLKPCPSGWTKSILRCIRYVAEPMTWADAEKNCQSLGGNLASVHLIEEYNGFQHLIRIRTGRSGPAWLGGSDAQRVGTWLWSDKCPFAYTNWCQGEPNNVGGNQHCLQMNWTDEKCWDDRECNHKLPSICNLKL